MSYVRRPFNPLTPTPNQVVNELDQANENFDILAQVFSNNDPATRRVVDAVNSQYSQDADRLRGYTASQMPRPNTIPVALPNGRLDVAWLPDRVNLTNATSDYKLQVGEEAIINFTNATSVPLRIATQSGTLYNLYIYLTAPSFAQGNGITGSVFLHPNNTTYTNAFYRAGAVWDSAGNSASYGGNISAFELIGNCFPANCFSIVYNETNHKATTSISVHAGINTSNYARWQHRNCVWNNYTTNWTSLGTIVFPINSSGYILVRRLA